jgi:hypothetical protein
MTTLTLFDRPQEGTGSRVGLSGLIDSWQRKKRAIGGHHIGKFSIRNRGMIELTDFYNTWLGYKIVETSFGMESYSGLVWQLDLIKNGVNYRRTLNSKHWHNRIKVKYNASAIPAIQNWSENTDSSAIYGVMEYIYAIGEATSGEAQAKRNKELKDKAWPRSRAVGGTNVALEKPNLSQDGLYVTTVGFSATLNWRFRETSETDTASSLITTLIGETDFVVAGRIETNTLSVAVGGGQRIGDLINKIIGAGDTSDNLWKGGVYADQKFIYEPIPTAVDYHLREGALLDVAQRHVDLALIDPGFFVRDANAPAGGQPSGTSNIWHDPQISYCDELEYIWPDQLRLKFPGERTIIIQPRTQAIVKPRIRPLGKEFE